MSDEQGRRAARGAQRGGEEERARELRLRLRAGSAEAGHLRLAAELGDPAACLALAHRPEPAESPLDERVEALTFRAQPAALTRIALAAAELALRERVPAAEGDGALLALRAAEAWLACPCREHAQAAAGLGSAVWAGPNLVMGQAVLDEAELPPRELALRAVALAAAVPAAAPPYDRADALSAVLLAARALDESAVWEAIRVALLPWALA